MKKLNKAEADLLALEVIATTIAGASYQETNDAVAFAISKNIEIDTLDVSVGMASLFLDHHDTYVYPTCVVKLCFYNFDKWDLWSPTLKINSETIAEEATRLSTWLYNMTNVVILED